MMKFSVPVAVLVVTVGLSAQVTMSRLEEAAREPGNWLTYSSDYTSKRHSLLTQITPGRWALPG